MTHHLFHPVCFLKHPAAGGSTQPVAFANTTEGSHISLRPLYASQTYQSHLQRAHTKPRSSLTQAVSYFNVPSNAVFLHSKSCDLNTELTKGGAVPVVHMREPSTQTASRRPRGMWYYYAAGCSDMLWEPGRQFVAPHRLDAVLRGYMFNASCDSICATDKVVELATNPRHGKAIWGKHWTLWPPNITAKVQDACAETIRAMSEQSCPLQTENVAMKLAGSDAYDYMLAFLMKAAGYDSIRLNFQPKGGQNHLLKWHTELWDLRDLSYASGIEERLASFATFEHWEKQDKEENSTSPESN
ncbi:MAG: hypothetical protein SGPRY_009849, partial [Prymnesium sp.]